MAQFGLFDYQKQLALLDKAGDPLIALNKMIDWEQFRSIIERAREKPRKSPAGPKGYDSILLFKILILQSLYNLSDESMEYQILDRYSFSRFLGISQGARVPDATTIFRFRDELARAGVIDLLFSKFDQFLHANGFRAQKGQIVDANIVRVPTQRNTRVENKDVIIGKVVPIKKNRNDQTKVIKYQDQSKVFRTHEETYIDKNYVERNGDGYSFCKVRLRTYRVPVIGDKFSSRHGQKGTVGIILPEEDMPFTESGIRPDIIINPHAIPSRMTIGQLKETVLGKALVELGTFGDGTSFNDFPVKDICKELLKCGYEKHGNEVLMNGMTGEQMETTVFIGPTFYQRLKHMVNDKQHSRNQGPMVVLTRQPAEGRSRDGGLRFGEMERDCMVSHGASRFTKGRIYDASDKFMVHVCRDCGMIAAFNNSKEIHRCNSCDNTTNFAKVEIPYACKLLFQELISMNVAPRIMTAD